MENKIIKKKVSIVSPWVEFYRKLEAWFKDDPDVKIEYDNDEPAVKLYICGQDKYEAISQILPTEKEFGNVKLMIDLIPDNKLALTKLDLFRRAFAGNPAVTGIITVHGDQIGSTNDFNYVVCQKKVVQYHNDTLADPHGTCSTLYQEIAKDLFGEQEGIYFCTDRD